MEWNGMEYRRRYSRKRWRCPEGGGGGVVEWSDAEGGEAEDTWVRGRKRGEERGCGACDAGLCLSRSGLSERKLRGDGVGRGIWHGMYLRRRTHDIRH